ncbi:hypothetical protein FBZ94_10516 [Bradyrhizobium sacchari]|uniref:Uncharacterized protein n=1 Tax=Bradyrhizobium sacchari TaxID=1399419 RepID=A0A560JX22_9BRAD|nr:hypothetical protein FBZ94_10516 [Bradyrhizobium sacchari]TWB72900.1 hypothetical protein FBZ95_106615 [Bradyrhizobium sacchari]
MNGRPIETLLMSDTALWSTKPDQSPRRMKDYSGKRHLMYLQINLTYRTL